MGSFIGLVASVLRPIADLTSDGIWSKLGRNMGLQRLTPTRSACNHAFPDRISFAGSIFLISGLTWPLSGFLAKNGRFALAIFLCALLLSCQAIPLQWLDPVLVSSKSHEADSREAETSSELTEALGHTPMGLRSRQRGQQLPPSSQSVGHLLRELHQLPCIFCSSAIGSDHSPAVFPLRC